ncbi:hypothetical protein GCM10010497_23170 [Streptomyces cinereoruber]|uniref:Uncharacterized protein n=1 Tax=Streptomyces cinereoruber TaxID=67260 RepID=A0AAV4KFX1_9ACTN|nr:hypothetical protein GCM10010497_23170 [Streptomyces cinereoruber]
MNRPKATATRVSHGLERRSFAFSAGGEWEGSARVPAEGMRVFFRRGGTPSRRTAPWGRPAATDRERKGARGPGVLTGRTAGTRRRRRRGSARGVQVLAE